MGARRCRRIVTARAWCDSACQVSPPMRARWVLRVPVQGRCTVGRARPSGGCRRFPQACAGQGFVGGIPLPSCLRERGGDEVLRPWNAVSAPTRVESTSGPGLVQRRWDASYACALSSCARAGWRR